jgi:hypothetical protein
MLHPIRGACVPQAPVQCSYRGWSMATIVCMCWMLHLISGMCPTSTGAMQLQSMANEASNQCLCVLSWMLHPIRVACVPQAPVQCSYRGWSMATIVHVWAGCPIPSVTCVPQAPVQCNCRGWPMKPVTNVYVFQVECSNPISGMCPEWPMKPASSQRPSFFKLNAPS